MYYALVWLDCYSSYIYNPLYRIRTFLCPCRENEEMINIPREEVVKNRLIRKIEKLKKKISSLENKCKHYVAVINLSPSLVSRYQVHSERMEERQRVRGLERRIQEQNKRIREQEKLIEFLEKQNVN